MSSAESVAAPTLTEAAIDPRIAAARERVEQLPSPRVIDQSEGRHTLQRQIDDLRLSIAAGENSDPFKSPLSNKNPGALLSPSSDLKGDRKRLAALIGLRENWDQKVGPSWQAALDAAQAQKTALIHYARVLAEGMPGAFEKDQGFRYLISEWSRTTLAIIDLDMRTKSVARELGVHWTRKRPSWPGGGKMSSEDVRLLENPVGMAVTIAGYLASGTRPQTGGGKGQISSWGGGSVPAHVQSEGGT